MLFFFSINVDREVQKYMSKIYIEIELIIISMCFKSDVSINVLFDLTTSLPI